MTLALFGGIPLVLVLVLVGCGSGATTAGSRTTPIGSSTPVSTDTAACATGRCEVRMSSPETISFKPGSSAVLRLDPTS